MSPGRTEGWGEGVFKIWFYFSLSYSDLIGNKLNYFTQLESFLPMTVTGEWSLSLSLSLCLSQPTSLSLYFLSPVQLRRGVTEWLWCTPGIQPGSTHHSHKNV